VEAVVLGSEQSDATTADDLSDEDLVSRIVDKVRDHGST
jgi:hypothetical protein